MGQLFKSFKRYNYRLSNFLNSSKNCSNDSTMTGLKIAIIFFAIAMISGTANAGCSQNSDCEESHACDTSTNRCYSYSSNSVCNGDSIPGLFYALDDVIDSCNSQSSCNCFRDAVNDGIYSAWSEASTHYMGNSSAWVKT